MRSNCLIWALTQFIRHGGYITCRRGVQFGGLYLHFLWAPTINGPWYSYSFNGKKKWPWPIFKGEIIEGDPWKKHMELILVRDDMHDTHTFGKLYVDGVYECETLEDCDRFIESRGIKVYGQTAIPRGKFRVIIDRSNRFSGLASKKAGRPVDVFLPKLLQVPYFDGIRIHPLNSAAESEGCIGVGKTRDGCRIGSAKAAFNSLFAKLEAAQQRGEEITIEVR